MTPAILQFFQTSNCEQTPHNLVGSMQFGRTVENYFYLEAVLLQTLKPHILEHELIVAKS